MASTFGAGWRSRTAIQWPIGSGRVGVAAADVAPQRHRLDAVDHDEVEQPVEVEVDEGGAAGPVVADDARPSSAPSTNVPSAWPISRLLGSRVA